MKHVYRHRRRATGAAALLLVFCVACHGWRTPKPLTATCIDRPDTVSLRLRGFVRNVAAADDVSSVGVRARLGIATTDPNEVVALTDARTCMRVLAGMNDAFKSGAVSRPLYVYAIGPNYAAFDKREVVAHQGGAVVFLDSAFAPLGIVLAPSVY